MSLMSRPLLRSIDDWLEYRWFAFLGVLIAGAATMFWLGAGMRLSMLIAFDLTATTYLIATIGMMFTGNADTIRRHAKDIDSGRWFVLTASILLSATVLAALGVEIQAAEEVQVSHLVLAAASIVVSWLFMNTMFAMHYAHSYYEESKREPGGLIFPGREPPDYFDFLYVALVIGMTFQVSDVAIVDRRIRRVALLQAVVAFFFNVIVISLAVSTLAPLME
jgi:uncharacterized membrane protein